jgi:hypothetical protein
LKISVFRINIKLLSNPVAELKIRENDSHCLFIVLKTMDRSIVKQLEKEKNCNFNVENCVVMFIYWGTIKRYMDRDWTASFSIRLRNGTCIIILDKKYNITNSSCHFGSYGSKYYMDLRSFGPYNIFWWRNGPYTAIWPSVPWTICYLKTAFTKALLAVLLYNLNLTLDSLTV